jgi:hypothetical protein
MRRRNKPWTDAELQRLKTLIRSRASALRASVALKRFKQTVRNKARELGTPFPSVVAERMRLQAKDNAMPTEPMNGQESKFSEEDIQREKFGARGVPGKVDPAKMTPQREKKQPNDVDPGHTA